MRRVGHRALHGGPGLVTEMVITNSDSIRPSATESDSRTALNCGNRISDDFLGRARCAWLAVEG
jgi:hypothetical protein